MKFLKWLGALFVALLLAFAGLYIYLQVTYYHPQQKKAEAANARLDIAKERFAERCKGAGVTIHRTVEDVEGIFLMKIRPHERNDSDQFMLSDPYGKDLRGDGYILSFIQGSYQATTTGTPAPGSPPRIGYHYVEAIDPADGKRYRYTGRIDEPWRRDPSYGKWVKDFVLDKAPAPGPRPRYGVTYDDISTREDREYWIAGSSLKVIDLESNEVIAERIGYMMDYGQGNMVGGRSPWLMAAEHACPTFQRNSQMPLPKGRASSAQYNQTQDFVETVLKPKMEK